MKYIFIRLKMLILQWFTHKSIFLDGFLRDLAQELLLI